MYKDSVRCDIVNMNAYQLLLERPGQFDRASMDEVKTSAYNIVYYKVKIALIPCKKV
jgi:hypothetical protein